MWQILSDETTFVKASFYLIPPHFHFEDLSKTQFIFIVAISITTFFHDFQWFEG